MKNYYSIHFSAILFLILLTSLSSAQTGWYNQVSGTNQGLFGIHFSDINNGVVVGTSGIILRTSNGGNTWVQQNSGTDAVLFDVSFVDLNNGYNTGLLGTILKTTDGGETWISQTSGVTTALFSIFFTDINNGTAVGHFGTILRTTNGGTTWVQQSGGTTTGLRSVFFTDINNGYIVGDNGLVLRTTNGGNDWSALFTGIQVNLQGVSFTDINTGTVVGGSNLTGSQIFRTTDGGLSWILQYSILSEVLTDVHFTDSQSGTAVGWNGSILRTTDGGTTWVEQNSNSPSFLSSVFFVNSDIGFTVGDSGTILATIDGGIPVELISFNAFSENNNVTLQWITGSEINNSGFEVERNQKSEDGIRTEWEKISFINGKGTTSESQTYSFTDKGLVPGYYLYRLKQIDYNGSYEYSEVLEVEMELPDEISLSQNYPNPFNPTTTITFSLPKSINIKLQVYNLLGEMITELFNGFKEAGTHTVEFNATEFNSGLYFYRIEAEGFDQSKKMILIK
jgi:photosystem II stability/assembly factor-like uncharacterized protein